MVDSGHPDPDVMSDFVVAQWPRLVRTAVMMGCRVQDAEDLAQETLVRCVRHWAKVNEARSPQAYVLRILVNRHRTFLSRAARRETSRDDIADLLGAVSTADPDTVSDQVREAMLDLSLPHRQILVLRYFCDLSLEETATALEIPVGTAKSRTARALAALSEHPQLASPRRSVQ